MREEITPPEPMLMESMRAVGYTAGAAIADIIDNAISAGASDIAIYFQSGRQSYVAILDDGSGMDIEVLRSAMRLAGKGPKSHRPDLDLGRFGLGLKTASLSQCRCLTVLSRQNGNTVGACWDLDHLEALGTWSLGFLDTSEMKSIPHVESLEALNSGTLVVWQKIDRIEDISTEASSEVDKQMQIARDHIALVFHRFLAGEHGATLRISINETPLVGFDPFLRRHLGTQTGPTETIQLRGESIRVRPFTLPFLKNLHGNDRTLGQVTDGLRDSQGFYVYRAMRLVVWGTWFRIAPKTELGKLARVMVDIPNSLDSEWTLDIKKSTAIPPLEIRSALRKIVERIVEPSRKVFNFRGRKELNSNFEIHVWNLIQIHGTFRYEVNREHPLYQLVRRELPPEGLDLFDQLVSLLESTYPVMDAYNRLSSDLVNDIHLPKVDDLLPLLEAIWERDRSVGTSSENFVVSMSHTEPFSTVPGITEALVEIVSR